MARACFDLGDYDEAIRLARATLPATDTDDRFAALQLIACAQARRGFFKQSLETLAAIGPLVDDLPPESKAKFFGQRAFAQSKLGHSGAALIDLEAARYWAEESEDQESVARARNNLAQQYKEAGRFDEALVEVGAAIEFAETFGDEILLGDLCDMKAQVMVDAGRYREATEFSERAITLLVDHPSLTEARATYGRALIGLGATYLEQEDPVATFAAKRRASDLVKCNLDQEIVHLALERSNGHVSKAANSLNVSHKAIQKFADAHKSNRVPVIPRLKSIITKK
jgi:tetratricopeptide (TPR) repeat protein